jgi:methionyl-tRNA formyltransferase
MGTPAFAVPVLQAVERIARSGGGTVVAAYAGPDRGAGRGRHLQPSPVKSYAEEAGIAVLTPRRVTSADETARFEALEADLVVLAAYGLLLPPSFLSAPRHGAVNVHPSLLPRHRGAAPVAGAILAGDTATGTTIIRMDEGLDTGPILAQSTVTLAGGERTPALTERLFALGASLLEQHLPTYLRGELEPTPQPEEGATLIKRFVKEDGTLDWSRPAFELERRVRALDPWPGTATTWEGKRLDVLEAAVVAVGGARNEPPGMVVTLASGVGVVTGEGTLLLRTVRLEGRQAVTGEAFLRGHASLAGARLGSQRAGT